MLVVPRDGGATLLVPELEAPRVVEQPGVFVLAPWSETDDPVAAVAALVALDPQGDRHVGPQGMLRQAGIAQHVAAQGGADQRQDHLVDRHIEVLFHSQDVFQWQ